MRKTRSRKTHKRHSKRRTRRRGGMNAPGGKPGVERPTPRPGVKTNQPAGPAPRPLPHHMEPMRYYPATNRYGYPLSFFNNAKKNKGFKAAAPAFALPGAAAAAPRGNVAPLARQAASPNFFEPAPKGKGSKVVPAAAVAASSPFSPTSGY